MTGSAKQDRRRAGSLQIGVAELNACVADLGTILPITAALVVLNGVDPVATLTLFGLVFVACGVVYRVPVPVQPIKAAGAIAIATGAPPGVIAGAGLIIGAVLVVLAALRAGPVLMRLFPNPVIRGNQLAVGLLLVGAAWRLLGRSGAPSVPVVVLTGGLVACLFWPALRTAPAALALVAAGVAWSVVAGRLPGNVTASAALPGLDLPSLADLRVALPLLVLPQLPLTLANAVVGTNALSSQYFARRARRVWPGRLLLTSGLANVAAGMMGGIPMCHGSSGLTAYWRAGARTAGVNLVAGALFLSAGVLFAGHAAELFALVPPMVLAALLAYTGLRHGLLAAELRGADLAVAIAIGLLGGVTGNLLWGMVAGIPAALWLRRRHDASGSTGSRTRTATG